MPIMMIKLPKTLIDSGFEEKITDDARKIEPEIGSITVKNAGGISIGCKIAGDGSNMQHLEEDYPGLEIYILEEEF